MTGQQPDASDVTKNSIRQPFDSQEVQSHFAHWVTNEDERQDVVNMHDETTPLPVLLLHLYRDLLRFYERNLGMSQSRVMLLHELMHSGEISQIELAHRLGIEAALLTRFAKQMEASGLLSRRVDPRDNRFTLVTLTPAGQQVFRQMMVFSREFEAQLVKGLNDDEQTSIRQSLLHIQKMFSLLKESEHHAEQEPYSPPVSDDDGYKSL